MTTNTLRICLVEDDELMGEALSERFEMEGLACDWHPRGKDALLALQRRRYSIVVSDINLPDISGEELFVTLREARTDLPPFLFMTGYGAIDQAVRLLKLGAADYVAKPLDVDALVQRIRTLGRPLEPAGEAEDGLGLSPAMQAIDRMLGRLATSDGTVLITGESGVGKEQVARRLHALADGGRARPFVAVNCGAIPDTLLEAELFGFEKGAFTGAIKERRGYFEQADGGTLFLDEVGDMPPAMQVKLLRAIQERTITRVGAENPFEVDVRLVCATHEDLHRLVEAGRFREDLYYRINVIHLRIPPLRERREDILWLARRFLAEQSGKRGGTPFALSATAERGLLAHPWPGNIRELKNAIERACILSERPQISPEALLGEALQPALSGALDGETLAGHLERCEKRYLEQALSLQQWRIGDTAEALGISRKTLWEKMKKHGIAEPTR
ncbi:two component, sigma54 specific, transcriptional regulator, Fis family [Stutzerimonas stutzeri]|uniref:sigma-54-dependent transcriptional regulator n=1 Tax=Stutzerimonas stutzeri TaxID=316 RepID=UPI002231025C|nr:sigma-54 dependent transcriptional regulator [Stutzerimonas stutzeri]GBC58976.1 two component, sigma54 specific, transcriptional regulator, Fis family [Stutzerimonas stutzeri]